MVVVDVLQVVGGGAVAGPRDQGGVIPAARGAGFVPRGGGGVEVVHHAGGGEGGGRARHLGQVCREKRCKQGVEV